MVQKWFCLPQSFPEDFSKEKEGGLVGSSIRHDVSERGDRSERKGDEL